jgi:cysteine-rich repeat protein
MRRTVRRFGLALLAVGLVVLPAQANFHLMKVVEVFAGTPASPNAKYVMIQMYASNQAAMQGHTIKIYDASGALVDTFTFGATPTNPKPDQTRILIATPEADAFFNFTTVDLVMDSTMAASGGKACFDAIDCVAWGNYTGSASGVGTPVAPGGIPPARAIARRLDIAGGAGTLDAADDTDNSANDFLVAMPRPQGSDGILGTPPANTCGNGVIESLEQCDDHNTLDGDSCSAACATTTPAQFLSIADVATTEGDSGTKLLTFTVTLDHAASNAVTFDLATANGSATAGSDYVAKTATGQTIAAGATGKTFAVTVNGDTAVEASETFVVDLTNAAGAGVADGQATGTIQNDDLGPSLSVADVKVVEGASGTRTATFTVKLSSPASQAVTYDIATANATATAGSDYVAKALVGETIPAGTLSRTFAVTTQGDTAVEANETFTVDLSNASTGIADAQAIGTIVNDDGPTLSVSDVKVVEGNSGQAKAIFVVRLSQAAAVPVTYSIATSNASALAGSDYITRSLNGESIPAGSLVRNFIINVNGDSLVEANENFVANLSNATGASIFDAQATATILNDDGPTLSIGDATTTEGASGLTTLVFTASLSQAATAPVNFSLATADGSATVANADYVARSATPFSIPTGMLSKSFGVSVRGDGVVEPDETFLVNVSGASGPASVFDAQAVGTITNDDVAAIGAPAYEPVSIGAVQGQGSRSPLEGRGVAIEGVATLRVGGGFYVQDAGDGDARTADGVFVASGEDIAAGARVRVLGTVAEVALDGAMAGATQTRVAAAQVERLGTVAALPAPVRLAARDWRPTMARDALERFEGMRLALPAARVVGPVGADARGGVDGRFFVVAAGVPRPFREPGLAPGIATAPGKSPPHADGNPERLRIDSIAARGAPLLTTDVGDRVDGLVGALDAGGPTYRLLADADAKPAVRAGARPTLARALAPSEADVVVLELERFFADGDPGRFAKAARAACTSLGAPAALALRGDLDRHVLARLVAVIDATCATPPRYAAHALPGGALLLATAAAPGRARAELASPIEALAMPRFTHPDGRAEPLFPEAPAQVTVRLTSADGHVYPVTLLLARFDVLVGDLATPDAHGWPTRGDGLNARRRAQALALAMAVQARQQRVPDAPLAVLGGFEAPEFNAGVDDLVGVVAGHPAPASQVLHALASPVRPRLHNLVEGLPAAQRYTATVDGEAQALDHVLANAVLLARFGARAEAVRLNADFGADLASDDTLPLRVSTHDPLRLVLSPR